MTSAVDISEGAHEDKYENMINQDLDDIWRTRTFSSPSNVLQSTGIEKYIDAYSNWTALVRDRYADYYKIYFYLPWGYIVDGTELETSYGGSVAKYYDVVNAEGYDTTTLIEEAKYSQIIPYNQYSLGAVSHRINVGEKLFTNWNMSEFETTKSQSATGPGGPCVIIKTSNSIVGLSQSSVFKKPGENSYGGDPADFATALPVYNIKRNVTPYGGITHTSRQNSVYMSTGAYKNVQTDVDIQRCVTYGGDTYLNLLDYLFTATFQANDEKTDTEKKHFVGCYVPFESSINMNLFNGDMAHRSYRGDVYTGGALFDDTNYNGTYLDTHLQTDVTQKGTYHVQDRPYYVYNPVYSTQNGGKQYVPASIYSIAFSAVIPPPICIPPG